MKRMRRCAVCGTYSLLEAHCRKQTDSAHPARFNPNDPYGALRRRSKGIAL
ncbi:MAG: nucleolar RNA-binding Nop10p family protein [Candidatus Micrarchaeota archaeon]